MSSDSAARGAVTWARHHAVFLTALVLAVGSALFVPPDADYVGYFDARTLTMLFCMLATITALQRVHFFSAIAARAVRPFHTLRGLVLALVLVTALASALFTNDIALIGGLPLAYRALQSTGNERHLAFTFVMMAVAANLGGMITPLGSPPNLYLHSFFSIPTERFVAIMLLPYLVSMALIVALCLLLPRTRIGRPEIGVHRVSPRVWWYLGLFVLTLLVVFRVIPVWAGVFVPLVLLILDRAALARLDWGLLGTFAAFFVFAGNLARIPVLSHLLEEFVRGHVLLAAVGSSQVISNVPSSILLSHFTTDYAQLLVGVNIGGVGTLVASLASLIALAQFRRYSPRGTTGRFIGLFSLINFGFLAVLLALALWMLSAGILT